MTTVNLIIPGSIWPEVADLDYILHEARFDGLIKIFNRAHVSSYSLNYSDFMYNSCFVDHNLSLAANYAIQLNLDKNKNYLLVEPTNLRPDRDRLLIAESDILQLNEEEANHLIEGLNEYFNPDEVHFYLIDEHKWLVELPYKVDQLSSYPLIDIIGSNIDDYLPAGENYLLVHRLLNEVQMLLHSHPINQERQQDGLMQINSIWLWDKNYKQLPREIQQIVRFDTLDGLLANTNASAHNKAILIDSVYFALCYRDSFAWVNNMNKIVAKIIDPALKLLQQGKIAKLNLWIPMITCTRCVSLSRISLYKFWKKADYKSILSRWENQNEL